MNKGKNKLITIILAVCMVVTSTVTAFAGTIALNKTKANVAIGDTMALSLKYVKSTKNVTWKSNDKTIAKVNSKGVVTGVSEGTATVTAKYKSKNYSCTVTVTQARNKEELEQLINEVISKSDKLGLSKADIIKLIDEKISKIPPSSSTTVIQSPSQNLSVYPTNGFKWKIACRSNTDLMGNGAIVDRDGITSSYTKNDLSIVSNSDNVQPFLNACKAFRKYSISFKATGRIQPSSMDSSYVGAPILVSLANETAALDGYIRIEGTINSDGTFVATCTVLSNSLGEYTIDAVRIINPNV